jgi:hypothetical protein
MKVLVCGGRDFSDRKFVFDTLDKLFSDRSCVVISGGARGVDDFANQWAKLRWHISAVVPAVWSPRGVFDKGAGPKRNAAMLALGPDVVVGFPGGSGTADMLQRSRAAGVSVIEISYNKKEVK